MNIFPNPSQGIYSISSPVPLKYYVYDTGGRTILKGELEDVITEINLSAYKNGVYFIRLDSGSSTVVKKLVRME